MRQPMTSGLALLAHRSVRQKTKHLSVQLRRSVCALRSSADCQVDWINNTYTKRNRDRGL